MTGRLDRIAASSGSDWEQDHEVGKMAAAMQASMARNAAVDDQALVPRTSSVTALSCMAIVGLNICTVNVKTVYETARIPTMLSIVSIVTKIDVKDGELGEGDGRRAASKGSQPWYYNCRSSIRAEQILRSEAKTSVLTGSLCHLYNRQHTSMPLRRQARRQERRRLSIVRPVARASRGRE